MNSTLAHPAMKLLRSLSDAAMASELELTTSDMFKVINVALESMQATGMDSVLTWLLLFDTKLFLSAILEFDVTLFNKLFDENEETHNSTVISLVVLEDIHERLLRMQANALNDAMFPDSINIDIFSISVLLEMTDKDFEILVLHYFNYETIKYRFQKEMTVVHKFFEAKHIPKLLRLLEKRPHHGNFSLVWSEVDGEQAEIVQNFIWSHYLNDSLVRNSSHWLSVRTLSQLAVVRGIAQRIRNDLESGDRVLCETELKGLFNFFMFKELGYNFNRKKNPIGGFEIILSLQDKLAISAILMLSKYRSISQELNCIIFHDIRPIYESLEESFRRDFITAAFRNANVTLSKYYLEKFLSDWHKPKDDKVEVIPEHVVLLKEAYSRLGPGFRDNPEFLEFQDFVTSDTN
jgi:hypothetical protein